MKLLFQILSLVVLAEVVLAAVFSVQRLTRVVPVLPSSDVVEKTTLREFQQLALQAEQGSAEDWMSLGEALLGQGYYAHAEPCFREAIAQDSDDPNAVYYLAFCLDRTGRTQASTPLYQDVVRSAYGQRRTIAKYAIGRNYLREENAAAAENAFREIETYPPAAYQLAKLLMETNKVDEALKIVDGNLRSIPQSVRFLELRYYLMRKQKNARGMYRVEDAQAHAKPQMNVTYSQDVVNPLAENSSYEREMETIILDHSNHQIDIEQRDKAANKLKQSMKDQTLRDHHIVLYDLATYEILHDQPKRAMKLLQEIRQMGYVTADVHDMEGDIWSMQGEHDKAADSWKKSLRMFPYPYLHEKIAKYHQRNQQPEKRDEHLAKSHLLSGMEAFRDSKFTVAERHVQKSIQLNSEDAHAWYYRGEISRRLSKTAEAKTSYKRCLSLNPNHGRAMRQLGRLENGP